MDAARLRKELDLGHLVIASVHPEIRRPQTAPATTGGHLVLVHRHDRRTLTFHDPAGHVPEALVATMDFDVFARFSAGRGVSLRISGTAP